MYTYCDERHIIARNFFQRCGFQHEATLRKHRILHSRNSNSAIYVLLNSDWDLAVRNLLRLLNLPMKATGDDLLIESVSSGAKEGKEGVSPFTTRKMKRKRGRKK